MLYVKVRSTTNDKEKTIELEKALNIFKRKVKNSKLMIILFENAYYKKPSELKAERKNKAKSREKWKIK